MNHDHIAGPDTEALETGADPGRSACKLAEGECLAAIDRRDFSRIGHDAFQKGLPKVFAPPMALRRILDAERPRQRANSRIDARRNHAHPVAPRLASTKVWRQVSTVSRFWFRPVNAMATMPRPLLEMCLSTISTAT